MRLPKIPYLMLVICFLLALSLLCAVDVLFIKNVLVAAYVDEDDLKFHLSYKGAPMFQAQSGQQFEVRRQHVVQACQNNQLEPEWAEKSANKLWLKKVILNNMYINRRRKLLFCTTPKVGSSLWKNILRVIDESNYGRLHLYDLSSTSAHTQIPVSITLRNASEDEVDKVLKTYTKFMFARDPFSRLFSAYMDKIFVPTYVGNMVLRQINSLNNKKINKTRCTRLLSFAEFCDLFSTAMLKNKVSDGHFTPIVYKCHPCFINFTYIGKMETFMSDTRDILRLSNINLTDITGGRSDLDKINDLVIVKDITMRVLLYHHNNWTKICLSYSEVGHRIWRHFQVRGMLSKDIDIPPNLKPSEDKGYSQKEFLDAIVEAFEKSYPNVNKHQQREEAMIEAYSSVSPQTLQKLARIFAEDCLIFNYSCDIDRFQNSSTPSFYFSKFS